jgi:hypothetical protein
MNVSLSFNNMFKWRGPMNIKWNSPFGYPNHALTQPRSATSSLPFYTQGEIFELVVLDFRSNKSEVNTLRMHYCGNFIHNEVTYIWMIDAIFKQRLYLKVKWLCCNIFYILCASSDQLLQP